MTLEDVNPEYHEAISLKIAYVNDLRDRDLLFCFSKSSTYLFSDFSKNGFCKVSSHDATRSNGKRRFPKPVRAKILGSNVGSVLFANQIIQNTALEIMYYDDRKEKFRTLTTSLIKEIILDQE